MLPAALFFLPLSISALHLAFSYFNSSGHYLWQSIWAGHIHAIRGKHLSRTRRKSEDASRAKSSDPWLFHNWELRPPIQLSSFALCDIRLIVIFLEHLHGLVLCENDSTNQTVRTGTLGKSRQMKPKLRTL